jgi:hypothetical protein
MCFHYSSLSALVLSIVASCAVTATATWSIAEEFSKNVQYPLSRNISQNRMQRRTDTTKYRQVLKNTSQFESQMYLRGTDGEVIDAMELFFFGSTGQY